jgi:amino acid transporter
MGIFLDLGKWTNYLSAHWSTYTNILFIISIISFIVFFIIFSITHGNIGSDKVKNGSVQEIGINFGCSILLAIGVLFVVGILSFLGVLFGGLITLFGMCFGLAKFVNYQQNKPKKESKLNTNNIDEIAMGVYNEMRKLNSQIKYEDIKASIEKKFR